MTYAHVQCVHATKIYSAKVISTAAHRGIRILLHIVSRAAATWLFRAYICRTAGSGLHTWNDRPAPTKQTAMTCSGFEVTVEAAAGALDGCLVFLTVGAADGFGAADGCLVCLVVGLFDNQPQPSAADGCLAAAAAAGVAA